MISAMELRDLGDIYNQEMSDFSLECLITMIEERIAAVDDGVFQKDINHTFNWVCDKYRIMAMDHFMENGYSFLLSKDSYIIQW